MDNTYKKTIEEYKTAFCVNLGKYPFLKSLFKQARIKRIMLLNEDNFFNNQLYLSLALGRTGVGNIEKLLEDAKKFQGYKSLFIDLSNNINDYNAFLDHLCNLHAAQVLGSGKLPDLKGKKIIIKFPKANNKTYDILYLMDGKKYYVSVKNLRSIDPSFDIFKEIVLKKSISDTFFRNKIFNVEIEYTYQGKDFKETDGLEKRLSGAINDFLDKLKETKAKELSSVYGSVKIDCDIEGSYAGTDFLPVIMFGRSSSGILNIKKECFYRFGRIYSRILDHVYKVFLELNDLCDEKTLKYSRLMIMPTWPIEKINYQKEIETTIRLIINHLGLDEFMKVDIFT